MTGILQIWFKEAIKYHYQQKAENNEAQIMKAILKQYKIK